MRSMVRESFRGTAAMLTLVLPCVALAKVPPEQAERLGGEELNCMGGVIAGTDSGVAEWTGQWTKEWPGMKHGPDEPGFEPGPYADEKPLFTIDSANMAQYADRLTEGEKALFEKYPDKFRMNVYPSHRDFGFPDWACETARKNALSSEVIDDGLGASGIGGGPTFPFPQNGLEAIWSAKTSYRPYSEQCVCDIAIVYGGGNVAWGRNKFMTMNLMNDPEERPSLSEKINTYFYTEYLLPDRNRGEISVGFQVNNYQEGSTQAWQYLPGTRRVRQAPEVGYDYPIPPAGLHTTDEDVGFNGSPDRYTWKLVGRKEMYVPYNNFRINDPSVSYDDLVKGGTLNPDYMRYELHRVWVVEAELKEGLRHIYAKRRLYIDEDTWQIMTADHYDARGALWRVPMILYYYSHQAAAYHRGVQIFHDLNAGSYEANNLLNERDEDDFWDLNQRLSKRMFSPEAAARAGR